MVELSGFCDYWFKFQALEGGTVIDPPTTADNETSVESKNDVAPSEEDSFEEELCWCIHQLQLGVQNQKANKSQRK